jgi:hypothetical protein
VVFTWAVGFTFEDDAARIACYALRGELTVVLLEIEKKTLGGRRFEGSVSATACGRGHEVPPKLFHFLRQSHVSFAAA